MSLFEFVDCDGGVGGGADLDLTNVDEVVSIDC